MAIVNRIAFLRQLALHGAKLTITVSANATTLVEKVKVDVSPSTSIDPSFQECALATLDMLAHACTLFHVADRGHKRSNGDTTVVFYVSHGRRFANAASVDTNPQDVTPIALTTVLEEPTQSPPAPLALHEVQTLDDLANSPETPVLSTQLEYFTEKLPQLVEGLDYFIGKLSANFLEPDQQLPPGDSRDQIMPNDLHVLKSRAQDYMTSLPAEYEGNLFLDSVLTSIMQCQTHLGSPSPGNLESASSHSSRRAADRSDSTDIQQHQSTIPRDIERTDRFSSPRKKKSRRK